MTSSRAALIQLQALWYTRPAPCRAPATLTAVSPCLRSATFCLATLPTVDPNGAVNNSFTYIELVSVQIFAADYIIRYPHWQCAATELRPQPGPRPLGPTPAQPCGPALDMTYSLHGIYQRNSVHAAV